MIFLFGAAILVWCMKSMPSKLSKQYMLNAGSSSCYLKLQKETLGVTCNGLIQPLSASSFFFVKLKTS